MRLCGAQKSLHLAFRAYGNSKAFSGSNRTYWGFMELSGAEKRLNLVFWGSKQLNFGDCQGPNRALTTQLDCLELDKTH